MEVRTTGRLVYIEPNNIRSELGLNYGNGDNISWRPEDLNISVDLQVIIPERDSCGQVDIGDNFIANIASTKDYDRKFQSFFSGTEINKDENYLTTEYTNISYQEIHNNQAGGKESLGIQSIDIQFDSHFFPVVKMKMVDVRGYSLMQPAEMQYRADVANKRDKKELSKACEQFFSALFHFPYPRFALSIKGFYGNRVTFMLAVNDFQSSFNAQTGNFEVEVSFIGHMYGFYSDLPLMALVVAPYIGSTDANPNKYWESQVNNGIFTFSDGTSIPTIKDFILNYDKMDESFSDEYKNGGSRYEKLTKVDNLNIERELLNSLSSEYNNLFAKVGTYDNGDSFVLSKCTFDKNILYFTVQDKLITTSYINFEKKYREYTDFIRKEDKEAEIPIKEPANKDIWGKSLSVKPPLYVTSDSGSSLYTKHEYYEKLKNVIESSSGSKLTKEQRQQNVLLLEKDLEFIGKINERIKEIDGQTTELIKASSDEIQEISKKILGINPTIENVMRMIFAHINAFMHAFYEVLGNINSKRNGERLLSNIKGLELTSTNISSKGTEDCFIPPFTTYFSVDPVTKERTKAYTDKIKAIQNFDEVKFVNSICEAIDAINKEIENSGNTSDTGAITIRDEWTELSALDYLYDNNPYRRFNGGNNTEEYINNLINFVNSRFIDATLNNGGTKALDRTAAEINKISNENIDSEVENFWKICGQSLTSNTTPNTTLKESLRSIIRKKKGEAFKFFKEKTGIINGSAILSGSEPKGFRFPKSVPSEGKYINGEWDYNVNANFLGNIYSEDNVEGTIEGRKGAPKNEKEKEDYNGGAYEDIIVASRTNEEPYCFPIVPIYTKKDGKLIIENYFTKIAGQEIEEEDTDAIRKQIDGLICCMVGTNNPYRFKNGTSLVKMPKNIVLYLGCAISNNSLMISDDGLYYGDGAKVAKKLHNGVTIEDLKSADAPAVKGRNDVLMGRLQNYYENWRDNEGKTILNLGKKWATTGDISNVVEFGAVEKQSIVIIPKSESALTSALIELNNTMVDILKIEPIATTCDYTPLLGFLKGVLNKMEQEQISSSGDEETESQDASTSEINLGKSGFSRELMREQMYYTLADLYDKWLAGYSESRFRLKSPKEDKEIAKNKLNGINNRKNDDITEIENFMYIDTFYKDISDVFLIDPKTIIDTFLRNDREVYTSVLQAISDIAFKNKLLFIPLPVFTNLYSGKNIASIFTPNGLYGENEYSLGDMSRKIGNTYVMLYTHEPSRHASNGNYNGNSTTYACDCLDIADTAGNINPVDVKYLNSIDEGKGYTIPAFGVTFGKQNQMYFKNISVSMASPRQTDVSIQNLFSIADMGKKGNTRNASVSFGQDLFSIYSNYSYECTVEMMGCMDIVPTMYFQLNNIPMFKGAYRIMSVKHHIENGSMTTVFTGQRINKNAIPFNNNVIDIESLFNRLKNKEASEGSEPLSGQDKATDVDTIDFSIGPWAESINYPIFHIPYAINRFKYEIPYVKANEKGETIPYERVKGTRQCARAVRNAVKNGLVSDVIKSIKIGNVEGWGNGYRCFKDLQSLGFRCIEKGTTGDDLNSYKNRGAKAGDIALIRKTDHTEYGHICMYDGKDWLSDYMQEEKANPYSKIDGYWIYRYQGRVVDTNKVNVKIVLNKSTEITFSGETALHKGNENGPWVVAKTIERDAKGTFKLSYVIKGGNNYEAYTYLDDEERKRKVAVETTRKGENTLFSLTDTCKTNQNPIFTNLVIIHK